MTVIRYEDFGARGDGKTDDLAAIARAHAYANENDLPVRADDKATYYLGGKDMTAVIETDTHFGHAKFIIDDRSLENISANIFLIRSRLKPVVWDEIKTLKRNQPKLDVAPSHRCLVVAEDENVKRYIRYGNNQNNGQAQTDVFIVDKDGNVDPDTPILWDFDQVTKIEAMPIDSKLLKITGGHFTTIANDAESKYTYHSRGIIVRRSNVTIDQLEHRITDEGDHGAPYGGFITVSNSSDVTVMNTKLSGHKTYTTIGSAGRPVAMGTYDITCNRAHNVVFVNCTQFNDIMDDTLWGIMASNYCKNLRYERCILSRFDAHQGVFNATVRDSTLGHMGLNAIGAGTLLVENSTLKGRSMINLRSDYGSTWQGEFIIRNCVFIPGGGAKMTASLINGHHTGNHNFGYTCYMPERIVIDNLRIDDANHPDDYKGPAIFADFNPQRIDSGYVEKYPYVLTKQVILKNVTTASGKPLRVSDNPFMFKSVEITKE